MNRLATRAYQWCTNTFEVSQSGVRLLPLEGLRGLAVALVFMVHYDALFSGFVNNNTWTHSISAFAGAIGNTGVDLFFVISGYLIYGAMLSKRPQLLKFWKRRVQRIYPTFLAVFFIYVALLVVIPKSVGPSRHTFSGLYILSNVLLLPGILPITPIITVAWSLSYEMFFYLTLPVMVLLLNLPSWTRSARIALFSLLLLLHSVLVATGHVAHMRFSMFAAGILLCEVIGSGVLARRLSPKTEKVAIALFVLGLATTPCFQVNSIGEVTGFTLRCSPVLRFVDLAIVFPMLMLCSFEFDGILARWFGVAPVRWLGNMSYSYYLIHGLTLHGLALLVGSFLPLANSAVLFWTILPLSFLLTLAVSTVLFVFVERPLSLSRAKIGRREAGPLELRLDNREIARS